MVRNLRFTLHIKHSSIHILLSYPFLCHWWTTKIGLRNFCHKSSQWEGQTKEKIYLWMEQNSLHDSDGNPYTAGRFLRFVDAWCWCCNISRSIHTVVHVFFLFRFRQSGHRSSGRQHGTVNHFDAGDWCWWFGRCHNAGFCHTTFICSLGSGRGSRIRSRCDVLSRTHLLWSVGTRWRVCWLGYRRRVFCQWRIQLHRDVHRACIMVSLTSVCWPMSITVTARRLFFDRRWLRLSSRLSSGSIALKFQGQMNVCNTRYYIYIYILWQTKK